MRIAICDDLAKDRTRLQKVVETYFSGKSELLQIQNYESADELLDSYHVGKYQIIFMDIYMEGISGVAASRRLRETDPICAIIFTTTSPDHAMAGYEVRVSDYLLKPYEDKDVYAALDWAIEHLPKQRSVLNIVSERERVHLPVEQIMYIEVYGRESQIHMAGGEIHSTNNSLSELSKGMGEAFLRCHRSYLVNLEYVKQPREDGFLLTNGDIIPIGTSMEGSVRQMFFDWSFRKTWESW